MQENFLLATKTILETSVHMAQYKQDTVRLDVTG
jgi:hypothetical protein